MQPNHHQPNRAARESSNAIVAKSMQALQREINSLIDDGHVIVGVDITCGRPTIQLMSTPHLARIADDGRAAYWMRGQDQCGHYRKGQLLDRECTVIWIERGAH